MTRRTTLVVFALTATTLAHRVFSGRPLMPVLVGTRPTGDLVPVVYQLLAFPAFGALVGSLVHETRRSRIDGEAATLLVATSAVAVSRLAGLHGLSGHVVFATATLVARHGLERALAAGALVGCVPFKLAWGDERGLVLSALVGVIIGASCRGA